MLDPSLGEISSETQTRLNYWIYCPKCRAMRDMRARGYSSPGEVAFRCPCGEDVLIEPVVRDEYRAAGSGRP